MKIQGFAAIALLSFAIEAGAAETDCRAFLKSIDDSQRVLSKLRARARMSAVPARADVQARLQHELTLLQINISIFLKSSCPAPAKPITADAYSKAADACEYAVRQTETNSPAPLPACDISKWLAD